MSKGGFDFMLPGVTVCEGDDMSCRKPAIGEFKRGYRELRAGWHPDMPISLCAAHCGERTALSQNELDKLSVLFFAL